MGQKTLFFVLLLCITIGCCTAYHPNFVHASETCYVDKNGDDDHSGSKDEPFRKISKALDEDCSQITVAAGTYNESIEIGKDVLLQGESRDSVTISGSVMMKDGAKMTGVKVSGTSGVDVEADAEAVIEDAAIVGASVGISIATGDGMITVANTKIYDGDKGIDVQTGNTAKISTCEIYDNDEEGIDIRSNVDGSIIDSDIHDNGSHGIIIVLGKKDLEINGNKIKKNKASGVMMQYYKGSSESDAIKMKNNTIAENKLYGVNCRVSSGGAPGKDFWSDVLNKSSNKFSDNKSGNFSSECSTLAVVASDPPSKEQKSETKAPDPLLAQNDQKAKDDQQQSEEEKKRASEEEEQQKLREKNEKNMQLKNTAETAIDAMQTAYDADVAALDHMQERSAFVMFLIGPRMEDIRTIEARDAIYEKQLAAAQESVAGMDDQTTRHVLQTQIDDFKNKRDDIKIFVDQQRREFSLFGWMFN